MTFLCASSLAALVGLCLTLSCKESRSTGAPTRGETPLESESPSAKIFPAPLVTGVPHDADGANLAATGSGGASGKKGVPLVVRTLPLLGPIEPEILPEGEAPGFQLDFQVPWPQAPSSVQLQGETHRVAPLVSFHLVPESARHVARVRVELAAGTLPLPAGTEFVASSDAEGWLVVWPDHRSYRVVSASSLRSILEERRVDRVPLVSVEATNAGVGRLLTRDTRRMQFESAMGTLTLESAVVPELGSAGALACAFFLALLRADARPHCVPGMVPVYARYQWAQDQVLEIGALRLIPRSDYKTTDFSLPPRLGIFKPGELPPLDGRPEFHPTNVWVAGEASTTWQVLNHHDVPLHFLVDGFPVAWLEPHVLATVNVPPGEHRHAARDWLGQVIEAGGVASGEGVARPTVQYGTPPEPEIE